MAVIFQMNQMKMVDLDGKMSSKLNPKTKTVGKNRAHTINIHNRKKREKKNSNDWKNPIHINNNNTIKMHAK